MSNVFRVSRCTFCENFIREVGTPSPCSSCANYSRFILAKSFEPSIKISRSDIEQMVKLEWRDNRPMVADCGDFNLNIFYVRENEYTIYASKGILGGEMYIGTTKSEDDAKQKAKDWVVDIVCSALGLEE